MGRHFDDMAARREEEAAQLEDIDIWKSVVSKVIKLGVDPQTKADILLQSIPDIGVIFSQLKIHNDNSNLADAEYHDILEMCISKLENEMKEVDFDPIKYRDT